MSWALGGVVRRLVGRVFVEQGAIAPVPSFSGEIVDLPPQTGLSDDEQREGILKMRRFLGELGVTQPTLRTPGIASMDHATVAAALLAALAILTKQTLIAAFVGGTLALALHDRREALRFLGATALARERPPASRRDRSQRPAH